MKRIVYPLLFAVLLATIAACIKPVIIFLAKRQLTHTFIASTVSIKGCDLNIFQQLSLLDVAIKKPQAYDVKIKEIKIQYTLSSILRGGILKVLLKDSSATIVLPKKSILEIGRYVRQGSPGIFSVKTLEISRLQLKVRTQELTLDSQASTQINLAEQEIDALDLKIASLEGQGFLLKEGLLHAGQRQPGNFFIQEFRYDKLKIENIKAAARLEGKGLFLDSLSARILGGKISGDMNVKIAMPLEYLADLKCANLDIEQFVTDFDLNKKFEMSGRLGGQLVLRGTAGEINILSGNFVTGEKGGMLVIKDTQSLEKIARPSGQPLDIVVESLNNYHYNKGVLKLSLDKDNLILDTALDGETGKRNIHITLHDFTLTRGGL